MESIGISVVLYQDEGIWIAQGLEFDITASGKSLPDVLKRFTRKLVSEVAICMELGETSLRAIKPAPQKFWKMFEDSRVDTEIGRISRSPTE